MMLIEGVREDEVEGEDLLPSEWEEDRGLAPEIFKTEYEVLIVACGAVIRYCWVSMASGQQTELGRGPRHTS